MFGERTLENAVKAVEYYLKEKVESMNEVAKVSEFIHFCCTSEDINNLSYSLCLKVARADIVLPTMKELLDRTRESAIEYSDIPILARTHGQPATPSTLGKEFANLQYEIINEVVSEYYEGAQFNLIWSCYFFVFQ